LILIRAGSKKLIAKEVISFFPVHVSYIEPFFGSGAVFFAKRKSAYNIVNDLDDSVTNFFTIIKDRKEEFINRLLLTPISETQLKYYKNNQIADPIEKAIKTLFVGNFTYLSGGETLRVSTSANYKEMVLSRIDKTVNKLRDVIICNKNYLEFLQSISFKHDYERERCFCYADPPYLHTRNKYGTPVWTVKDLESLIMELKSMKIMFAVSEFDSPEVIQIAKESKLIINLIRERVNLKNRRTEILLTNYNPQTNLFE